jgi:hypothetical protein
MPSTRAETIAERFWVLRTLAILDIMLALPYKVKPVQWFRISPAPSTKSDMRFEAQFGAKTRAKQAKNRGKT